jgi:hypothetical protein
MVMRPSTLFLLFSLAVFPPSSSAQDSIDFNHSSTTDPSSLNIGLGGGQLDIPSLNGLPIANGSLGFNFGTPTLCFDINPAFGDQQCNFDSPGGSLTLTGSIPGLAGNAVLLTATFSPGGFTNNFNGLGGITENGFGLTNVEVNPALEQYLGVSGIGSGGSFDASTFQTCRIENTNCDVVAFTNAVDFNASLLSTPEPATLSLALAGFLLLLKTRSWD